MKRGPGTQDRTVIHARGARVGTSAADTQRQQQLAVRSEFADGVVLIIGAIHSIVRPYKNAVRSRENPLTPGSQERAVPIKNDDRVLAAIKDVNAALPVGRHRGSFAPAPARRQLRPAIIGFVSEVATMSAGDCITVKHRCSAHTSSFHLADYTADCSSGGSGSIKATRAAGIKRKPA